MQAHSAQRHRRHPEAALQPLRLAQGLFQARTKLSPVMLMSLGLQAVVFALLITQSSEITLSEPQGPMKTCQI